MLKLLLAMSTALVLGVVVRRCCRSDGVVVDPVLTFSVGFVLYWLSPVCLGATGAFSSQPGMGLWYSAFHGIPPEALVGFTMVATGAYVSFIVGYTRGLRSPPSELLRNPLPFSPALLVVLFVPLSGLAALFAFVLRHDLFRGYTTASILNDTGIRGSFIATSLGLFGLALLRFSARALTGKGRPVGRVPFDSFFLTYFAVAVLVVSLGGRLYLMTALLILASYRSAFEAPIPYGWFGIGGLALVLGAALVGVLRLGVGVSPAAALFNLAAEPLFTSFSLLAFLANGHTPVLRAPIFLLGDFINLVPTALLPGKAGVLLNPGDYGFPIFAPLGALNSYFSFMINFGAIGTITVLYAAGALLARIRRASRSPIARTTYSMITGWLAFTFFRDPFSISVVKNIFEFSILMPLLFAAAAHVCSVASDTPVVPLTGQGTP